MTEAELLKLKKQVEEAKTNTAQLTGQRTAILKQLKEDLKCASAADAEKKLQRLNVEIEKITEQIEEGSTELEQLLRK